MLTKGEQYAYVRVVGILKSLMRDACNSPGTARALAKHRVKTTGEGEYTRATEEPKAVIGGADISLSSGGGASRRKSLVAAGKTSISISMATKKRLETLYQSKQDTFDSILGRLLGECDRLATKPASTPSGGPRPSKGADRVTSGVATQITCPLKNCGKKVKNLQAFWGHLTFKHHMPNEEINETLVKWGAPPRDAAGPGPIPCLLDGCNKKVSNLQALWGHLKFKHGMNDGEINAILQQWGAPPREPANPDGVARSTRTRTK